jgi:two-component system NarL family sensor kinase
VLSEDKIINFVFVGGTLFGTLLVGFLLLYVYLHQMKVNRFKVEIKEQELKKQRELFVALNEGEEKERKRLAEELHDGIGAKLSGLKMSLEYLNTVSGTSKSNDNLLQKIILGFNETIEELREISQNLQPPFMNLLELNAFLSDLVFHFNNKGTCKYLLSIETEHENLNPTVYNKTVFRIVSELLNNIQKHSNASLASVQIVSNNSMTQILVEDNGKGFDFKASAKGIGLLNIRNRIELYNGKFNIDSNNKGTIVIIELPNCIHEE